MSSGTAGGYWQGKALPSVFKHELLRRYIPPFGGMTGTQAQDRRVVYLDGYAGEGRYENGDPGSAEIAAITWPAPTCGARSTVGCRSWRTGTAPTPSCATARTAP
jgi:hypothetical protein